MKIFLIGYRCTGKTTIGKILAEHLNLNFIDTDMLIEQHARLSILQIVEKYGWGKFRQIEKEVLFTTQDNTNVVIATGGGIIINPENQIFIKKNGTCVWLDADLNTILHRLNTDKKTRETRPSLTNDNIIKETKEGLNLRRPLYEKTSHIKIDTTFHAPEKIVDMINRRLS